MIINKKTIPVEMLIHIFKECDPVSLLQAERVCKTFRSLLNNKPFWTSYFGTLSAGTPPCASVVLIKKQAVHLHRIKEVLSSKKKPKEHTITLGFPCSWALERQKLVISSCVDIERHIFDGGVLRSSRFLHAKPTIRRSKWRRLRIDGWVPGRFTKEEQESRGLKSVKSESSLQVNVDQPLVYIVGEEKRQLSFSCTKDRMRQELVCSSIVDKKKKYAIETVKDAEFVCYSLFQNRLVTLSRSIGRFKPRYQIGLWDQKNGDLIKVIHLAGRYLNYYLFDDHLLFVLQDALVKQAPIKLKRGVAHRMKVWKRAIQIYDLKDGQLLKKLLIPYQTILPTSFYSNGRLAYEQKKGKEREIRVLEF